MSDLQIQGRKWNYFTHQELYFFQFLPNFSKKKPQDKVVIGISVYTKDHINTYQQMNDLEMQDPILKL